jgi:rhamnose transport system permease protein
MTRLGLHERRWEALLLVILVVSIVFNVTQSTNYVGLDNFANLFELSVEKIIVVVVMTFVIINGEIDLSVASVMAVGASIAAVVHDQTSLPFVAAIVLAVGAGALAGLLQGWCVARLGVPSLVVTLAGLIGFRGVARILVEDRSIGDFPSWFDTLGQQGLIGPFPFSVLLFVVFITFGGIVLSRTPLGRRTYAIGDNAEMARFSGVDVDRFKIKLFVMSGAISAFAGVLFAARLGSVRGDLARGFELDIITMVLLGGVSIFGGSGTMLGVALAVLIVLNIRNGLGLANIEANTQTGIIGVILIASVMLRNLFDRIGPTGRPSGVADATDAPADTPPKRAIQPITSNTEGA